MKKIAIIGGGTLGASCAYYLSKHNDCEVYLIDRNTIGSGATSWAASLLTQVRKNPATVALVQETYKAVAELENNLGELGARRVGSMQIVSSENSLNATKKLEEIGKEFNLASEWQSPDQVKQHIPWMNKDMVSEALFYPDDMFLDAQVLASSYAKIAKANGATLMQYTEVKDIVTENNRISHLLLDNGDKLDVDFVVDAAGAWSNVLSEPLSAPVPYAPVRSLYWITKVDETRFPQNQPMTVISDARAYTRPETGALLFGIRDSESKAFSPKDLPKDLNGFPYITDERQWDILLEEGKDFLKFFPGFEDIGIAHYIAGFSTYTSDSQFIVGRSEQVEGLYFATGCVGAGVAVSGGYGRIVAEQIMEQETYIDASQFAPDRKGQFDPYSEEFLMDCSNSRSNKRDGG